MWRFIKFGSFGALLLLALLALSVGLNIWTYRQFTAEQHIAQLNFLQTAPRRFRARLDLPDGSHHYFDLRGDSWQLDARVLKWHGWLTWLGKAPLYRLERISGRYEKIEDERNQPRTVHSLSSNPGIDLWQLASEHEGWLPAVDASYGSAVYLPMRDGARYHVTLSPTGLLARPLPGTKIEK